MARDALNRKESCGSHFRTEYQTPEQESLRNDEDYCYVSSWEWKQNSSNQWQEHKENLHFEKVKLSKRSYK